MLAISINIVRDQPRFSYFHHFSLEYRSVVGRGINSIVYALLKINVVLKFQQLFNLATYDGPACHSINGPGI